MKTVTWFTWLTVNWEKKPPVTSFLHNNDDLGHMTNRILIKLVHLIENVLSFVYKLFKKIYKLQPYFLFTYLFIFDMQTKKYIKRA